MAIRLTQFCAEVLAEPPKVPIRLTQFSAEILAAYTPPVVPEALPGALDLLVHNWSSTVRVETSFVTDVADAAGSMAEDRRALRARPTRQVEVRWSGLGPVVSARMMQAIVRLGGFRALLPLYPDVAPTTAASSASTRVYCDPKDRRFFAGGRVALFEVDENYHPTTVEYRTIGSVDSDGLIVNSAVTLTSKALVVPLIDVEIRLEQQVKHATDEILDTDGLVFDEVIGPGALPGATAPPAGLPAVGGLPVWDADHDWATGLLTRVVRGGEAVGSGRGLALHLRGARPVLAFGWSALGLDRANAWRLIQFFESRRGRALAFWLAAPISVFGRWAAINAASVDFVPAGNAADQAYAYKYLAIVLRDGTIHIRTITGVTDVAGPFRRVSVNVAWPVIDTAEILRVTSAHLVRFAKDALTEDWVTNAVCRFEVEMVEVLAEGPTSFANL